MPLSTLVTTRAILGPDVAERYNLFRSATIRGVAAPGASSGDGIAAFEELGDTILARLEEQSEPTLGGRPVGVGRLLAQFASIASQTPGMRVAVGAPREPGQPLILYHVVQYEGGWRRVLALSWLSAVRS